MLYEIINVDEDGVIIKGRLKKCAIIKSKEVKKHYDNNKKDYVIQITRQIEYMRDPPKNYKERKKINEVEVNKPPKETIIQLTLF